MQSLCSHMAMLCFWVYWSFAAKLRKAQSLCKVFLLARLTGFVSGSLFMFITSP